MHPEGERGYQPDLGQEGKGSSLRTRGQGQRPLGGPGEQSSSVGLGRAVMGLVPWWGACGHPQKQGQGAGWRGFSYHSDGDWGFIGVGGIAASLRSILRLKRGCRKIQKWEKRETLHPSSNAEIARSPVRPVTSAAPRPLQLLLGTCPQVLLPRPLEPDSSWWPRGRGEGTQLSSVLVLAVARAVPGGAGQVLRAGAQGTAAPHAALPRLVRTGQLREWCRASGSRRNAPKMAQK